tara:strand:+ start:537 stop:863 length:327 start_codon:yes stop_codon:yes gene_type:complete
MQVKQGMRSVQSAQSQTLQEETDVGLQAQKKQAKKVKASQPKTKTDKGLTLVSTEANGARFDLILGWDTAIRGVRTQGGYMMFVIPPEHKERAMQHVHVVSGKLVEAE